ncbi:hypothetical protein BJY52DRAFT_1210559 [Lactarius psammicola]|nr:hypothetical protein BJY52DRAFT_1210559 [Lactarius psammicola]
MNILQPANAKREHLRSGSWNEECQIFNQAHAPLSDDSPFARPNLTHTLVALRSRKIMTKSLRESLERVSKDTQPRSAGSDDVLHGPEAAREIENPGPRQSPPSSQPVAPSALPLHLIPLLPQKSPSSKRQRRSIGLSSDQTDEVADDFSGRGSPGQPNATGGTNPSPQSLRLRLQNFSAESAGISRTLAYAMDQMNATHSSDYLPLRRAEPEKLVVTREAEVDREGDVATRPKTVRFEESTCPPAELAERLWTDAIQAVNTAHAHEESDQKTERAAQSDEQDEGATCGQDATIGGKNTASGKGRVPEGDVWSFLRKLGAVTLGKAEEGQSKDATWEMDAKARRAATEGISRTVAPQVGWRMEDAGNEAERAALALKPAQLQEYTRLKEQEVELRNAEAEIRTFEERLEAREKDLRTRLGTVRKRLEAIRQRRASINHQEEILRQKLEAVTKEAQGSANALGAVAPPESN